jgi:8-oxo-dGTP pyrophosphatase MutT (NUDIX family)
MPDDSFKYLMICRRNTIGLVEIIRGRYEVSNTPYIRALLEVMSVQEVECVRTLSFDALWDIVWREHANNFLKEKKVSEDKYNQIRPFIEQVLSEPRTYYKEPEWGFPKGRRNYKETHRMASIRELKEETSISPHYYALHSEPMFEESYKSYDGKQYKNIYFIGALRDHFDVAEVMRIHFQRTTSYEISAMKLLTMDECMEHIRDYNPEKRSMLREIDHYLRNSSILRHFNQPRIPKPRHPDEHYMDTCTPIVSMPMSYPPSHVMPYMKPNLPQHIYAHRHGYANYQYVPQIPQTTYMQPTHHSHYGYKSNYNPVYHRNQYSNHSREHHQQSVAHSHSHSHSHSHRYNNNYTQ